MRGGRLQAGGHVASFVACSQRQPSRQPGHERGSSVDDFVCNLLVVGFTNGIVRPIVCMDVLLQWSFGAVFLPAQHGCTLAAATAHRMSTFLLVVPIVLPAILLDHVRQFNDEFAFLVLLTRFEGMLLSGRKQQKHQKKGE